MKGGARHVARNAARTARPEDLLARYLKAREAGGMRSRTLRLQRILLGSFLRWLAGRGVRDLRRATPEDIRAYQRHLAVYRPRRSNAEGEERRPLAARTRYDSLAAVCRFFRWLAANQLLVADPAVSIELGKRKRFSPSNVLTEAEAERLLGAADAKTPIGLRDRALLELLYSSGLRQAETSALDVADVDLTGGLVFVRSGKGGKSRVVPLGQRAGAALRLYLAKARPLLTSRPGVSALFVAGCHGPASGLRLSAPAVELRVELAARKAGITRPVTPHALRHSLATHLLRAGAGLRHVQAILGHARIDTTEVYTHLALEDLERAHARYHPRTRRRST